MICNEGAFKIMNHIYMQFGSDEFWMDDLVQHKDSNTGSKAIHFAAASGHREVIEMLIHDFGANIHDLTEGRQTVVHCAA